MKRLAVILVLCGFFVAPHSYGEVTTFTYPNGDKYVGEFKGDKFHGQGTYTFSDGDKYVGEFKYGYRWQGTEYNESGEVVQMISDGAMEPTCYRKLGGWGTGFAVTQHHVVTNAHVIDCCKKVTIHELHQKSCSEGAEATVVATAQKSDLGLLRLDQPLKHYATLRSGKAVQLHETVSSYDRLPEEVRGCPQYVVGQGKVINLNWMPDDSRFMEHDSPISKGSSGGPVLDDSGHIIGVQQGSARGAFEALAVKPHLLEAFLESNRVEYEKASSTEKLSLSEIRERSGKFTVLVECLQ